MQVRHISLKQFRCFPAFELSFQKPIVLLSGSNGIGKTTLLEALHYACYLKSFRTHLPRELMSFEKSSFFIKITCSESFEQLLTQEIQIGFAGKKKVVKLDQKAVSSYKDLLHMYRVITVTEDDLQLIQGSPEERRNFIDQAIMLVNPDFLHELRTLKTVATQRTALLQRGNAHRDDLHLWTQQLWEQTRIVQDKRIAMLDELQQHINTLLQQHFNLSIAIVLTYAPKRLNINQSFDEFWQHYPVQLKAQESAFGRSLFGAHLDDFSITFQDKTSRSFASRGQQKLIVLLLKITQIHILKKHKGSALFLLDDFMSDFDHQTLDTLLELLHNLETQLIFTSPSDSGYSEQKLLKSGAQHVHFDHSI